MGLSLIILLQATAAAVAAALDVCALYTNSHYQFAFGLVQDSGNITTAQVESTWQEVYDGVDAGETANVFYAVPKLFPARKSSRRLSEQSAAQPFSIATVRITSPTNATTSYATLQPIKGYPGIPFMTSMTLDQGRQQMIGLVSQSDAPWPTGYFLIVDLSPQNGTTSKVWLDIRATVKTWGFFKEGVSAYDYTRGVYYFDAGLVPNDAQQVVGFSLTGNGQPIYTPVDPAWDVYTLKYSSTRDSLVALVSNKNSSELAYWELPGSAAAAGGGTWRVLFSYPTGKDYSKTLGLMELDPTPGSAIAVTSLQVPPSGLNAISWVDLAAGKEVKSVLLADPNILNMVDTAFCTF